jgi:hypothetical protein
VIVVGLLTSEPGSAFEIAARAAATGARVEMVGAAAPGSAGDQRLLELAAASVGHATVIRSGADSLEPADLELALRYLPDIRAVVLVQPPARLLSAAIAGADFAGAPLVIIGPLDAESLAALEAQDGQPRDGQPRDSGTRPGAATAPIILDPPARDPDGTFAGFVAVLAVRLDAGDPPEAAFGATVSALAVDPA